MGESSSFPQLDELTPCFLTSKKETDQYDMQNEAKPLHEQNIEILHFVNYLT